MAAYESWPSGGEPEDTIPMLLYQPLKDTFPEQNQWGHLIPGICHAASKSQMFYLCYVIFWF